MYNMLSLLYLRSLSYFFKRKWGNRVMYFPLRVKVGTNYCRLYQRKKYVFSVLNCTSKNKGQTAPPEAHSYRILTIRLIKLTIQHHFGRSWGLFNASGIQKVFPYNKMIVDTLRSTHVIFHLVTKPLVLVKNNCKKCFFNYNKNHKKNVKFIVTFISCLK